MWLHGGQRKDHSVRMLCDQNSIEVRDHDVGDGSMVGFYDVNGKKLPDSVFDSKYYMFDVSFPRSFTSHYCLLRITAENFTLFFKLRVL